MHASWLNQIEIFFSITQRKVLSPNDLTDTDSVDQRLADFEERHNQTARPFKWKFTATDLTDLLQRLDGLEPHRAPINTGPEHSTVAVGRSEPLNQAQSGGIILLQVKVVSSPE